MLRKINEHLGLKIFILLAIIIILSVVPLAYTAMQLVKGYGDEIAEVNELQIRSQAFSFLREVTAERSARYQAFFNKIAASAGLMASQASAIYSNQAVYAQNPLNEYRYDRQPHNGHWVNSIYDPVAALYWGGAELEPPIRSELQALTHMTPLFQQVLTDSFEVLASHMITVSGIGLYCTNNLKNKEVAFNLPPASVFDLRDGEPMTIFTGRNDPSRSVRWTDIYKDDVLDGLVLTASAPIYDESNGFRGIAGIDVPLDTVIDEVLKHGETRSDDTILFSFLLDRDGRMIALPDEYYSHFGLAVDRSQLKNSGDSLDIMLAQSSKQDVRRLAEALDAEDNSEDNLFTQLVHEGETYYVVMSRMTGLGWFSGTAVRESDMLTSVRKTRSALSDTIRIMEQRGLFLSLLIISVAVCIVFLTVKFLVTPLRTLAAATQRVAKGDLTVRCPVTTTDEAGVLAASFNAMVKQLQIGQAQQEEYAEQLKRVVVRKTHELVDKKGELERTVELLKEEVEQRQIIAGALRVSQQQYYDTMDASQAGIFILTDGRFTYVNSSLADLFKQKRSEMIGTDPLDLVLREDRSRVQNNMQRRFQGEEIAPYTIKCQRPDGTDFFGEVWAKIAIWQEQPVMVGTITDVSNYRLNEERIQVQDRQLQRSLEEKEVLFKEIHHRTKNNMMVVISMLDLQMADIEDERVRAIFQEMEDRIRAMALVHEKLYQSHNLSEIDSESYIKEIAESLISNMILGDKIRLQLEIEPMLINIDYAVPLGLVINEIVTNSVKYAFPDNRVGCVSIRLERNDRHEIELTVEDDGAGLPEGLDVLESSSFGMQIIASLVTMQLGGALTVDTSSGTSYFITFPEPANNKRI